MLRSQYLKKCSFVVIRNLAVFDGLRLQDVRLEREVVLHEAARVDDVAVVLKRTAWF